MFTQNPLLCLTVTKLSESEIAAGRTDTGNRGTPSPFIDLLGSSI